MWLFTKFGFYSVTKAKSTKKKGLFQIRARHDADLINLKNEVSCLKMKKVHCYVEADYRYRIYVWPSELAEVFVALQDKLDYSNFKNEVIATPNQKEKYSYYTKVWGVMYGYQQDKENEILGIDEQTDRSQLSIFGRQSGGYSIGETVDLTDDEDYEHSAFRPITEEERRGRNDYPALRELPYTEEQEKQLYAK
jgi:hypothetical protein